ncbi:MAG: universal stress protein [Alphaproteobacteria bacterium]|nr:universal stress protein [Alphaproteobacteria bacterium]
MFNKILHASDGSKHAFDALTLALAIAWQNNSELHIVCVEEIPYMPDSIAEVREATAAVAQKIQEVFQQARAIAEEQSVTLHTHTIAGHPVRDIVRLAADLNADLLVIGARGHSALYERMIGSKADRIVQLAPCPVLVVKLPVETSDGPVFKKILHANDGSKYGVHALTVALGLAQQNNAELHMVCVEEIPYLSEIIDESREMAAIVARRIEGVFQRARARAEEYRVTLHTHLMKGHPVRTIVKLATDLNVDLLIVGARGHSALYVRMIGSQADRIMKLAPCPVLVAK